MLPSRSWVSPLHHAHDTHAHLIPQGDALTAEQYAAIEELGILADKDDQGVLLQIFTKPLGDRCAAQAAPAAECACATLLGAGSLHPHRL